ncbi:PREDICTED: probable leucine-rich repeat receptor-like protein kinase IMK3 isoform X2 [Ipomoea nil]|uniref:probable leucine-rich repeat receptor-like protein kinase IMK3 isoform X2 n=1 Tax=Ipomoea nil TaxID=35883 RepID=UPI000901659C|nr:PREDICTED: probable leucine-rich repeat receptor-like protein kinase IMK3 isoform X2 [Ipomoea nil]
MEAPRKNVIGFCKYPFGFLRWKGEDASQMRCPKSKRFFLYAQFVFLFQLLMCRVQLVCTQAWDGVFVTQNDYQALQGLKHDFVDPEGFLKSWNGSGYGACSGGWVGIKCAQGQVIVIDLPNKGLGGRISENIGQFQALRKLSLHDNVIGGLVPTSLGFLPDLRGVQLFNNRFSGSIPASLGFCPVLQTLDLSNNSLSGSIPLNLTRSSSLSFLVLGFNDLSGSVPDSLGNMSGLQELSLDHNKLSGLIPDSIYRLQKLSVLDLSNNQFFGSVPVTIGNVSALTRLDLSHNNFIGEIPVSLDDLPSLGFFNVSYNNLSGRVPARLAKVFNESAFVGNLRLCGYNGSTPCPSSIAPSPGNLERRCHRQRTKNIILVAAGVLLVILLVICCVLMCCLFKKRAKVEEGQSRVAKGSGEVGEAGETPGKLVRFQGSKAFTADDLLSATADIMGRSTYGTVYKATLGDGNQIAVKRLRERFTVSPKEFESEVNSLGKIRHPNILALRAYYLGPKGEKLLVFDYMPRGSLATFLHARRPEDSPINWGTRMGIAKGIARGLVFLHNNVKLIHGNLTSGNVLLDENTNAKIADYALSRLMTAAANANAIATSGGLGYRAPELSKLKKANRKTDVHSLGVVMLELLTGKSPAREVMNSVDLPRWVASMAKEESSNQVFDVDLMNDASIIGDELLTALKLALHCVHPSPSARPEAQQVLQQLEELSPSPTSTRE